MGSEQSWELQYFLLEVFETRLRTQPMQDAFGGTWDVIGPAPGWLWAGLLWDWLWDWAGLALGLGWLWAGLLGWPGSAGLARVYPADRLALARHF